MTVEVLSPVMIGVQSLNSFGISSASSSFSSFGSLVPDAPIVSLDITMTATDSLGFQPLKHSLHEIKSALKQKLHFHDGTEWLKRFWFAVKDGGLPVIRIESGSTAANAGLLVCDVIVAINGRDCRLMPQTAVSKKIRKSIVKYGAITLSIVRCTALPYDPSACTLFAEQGAHTKAQSFLVKVAIPIKPENIAFGFTPLKYSLTETELPKMEKHMVKESRKRLPFATGGLPVQSVDPDGLASTAGLQAWDVIIAVNGNNVQTKTSWEIIQLIKQTMAPLNLSRETEEVLELTVQRSVTPIVQTTSSPQKSAFQRAISGLHWLASPGKGRFSNSCPAFGARASEADSGDIVIADITSFDISPVTK